MENWVGVLSLLGVPGWVDVKKVFPRLNFILQIRKRAAESNLRAVTASVYLSRGQMEQLHLKLFDDPDGDDDGGFKCLFQRNGSQ